MPYKERTKNNAYMREYWDKHPEKYKKHLERMKEINRLKRLACAKNTV